MRIDSALPPRPAIAIAALFGRNKTNPIPALPRLPPRRALRVVARRGTRGWRAVFYYLASLFDYDRTEEFGRTCRVKDA
jgi:hypothetical protein